MADIRDGTLYSREEWAGTGEEWRERFVTRMLGLVTRELTETGDRDWLVDCVAQTSIRISHLENMARRVASGLARLGLGPGHILHTAYNSQVSNVI